MRRQLRHLFFDYVLLEIVAGGTTWAEDCSEAITAEETLRAEDARYTAQTTNDFAAMERLFGQDLVYIHSTAAMDDKGSYIGSMRSGAVKYRAMRRSDVKVRTYGCLAIITGNAEFDVTAKDKDITVQLRFHSVWAKRGQGAQFVSWQSTPVPPKP
jgi:hypothetical protein